MTMSYLCCDNNVVILLKNPHLLDTEALVDEIPKICFKLTQDGLKGERKITLEINRPEFIKVTDTSWLGTLDSTFTHMYTYTHIFVIIY